MTIILRPEQEQVLLDAITSGLAHTADETLDKTQDALRFILPQGPRGMRLLRRGASRHLANVTDSRWVE